MIKAGDTVYLYHSDRMKYLVRLTERGRLSTHRGYVEFTDIIGREFGDSVVTQLGHRFHLLRPTLADLAMKVKRTTTIVYPKDTGMMLLGTVVYPGARVIECGSGSGALSVILANFVRPEGRVYSYERRPEFSANARENVKRYGLEEFCEFKVADPEHDGFGERDVDAVFLDLPEPWTVMRAAHEALRGGYSLVSIVPTFEQLRKVTSVMEMEGFARIRVLEMLERGILIRASGIRPGDRMIGHTIYLVFGHKVARPEAEAVE